MMWVFSVFRLFKFTSNFSTISDCWIFEWAFDFLPWSILNLRIFRINSECSFCKWWTITCRYLKLRKQNLHFNGRWFRRASFRKFSSVSSYEESAFGLSTLMMSSSLLITDSTKVWNFMSCEIKLKRFINHSLHERVTHYDVLRNLWEGFDITIRLYQF